MINFISFYLFAIILIISALKVVTAKNSVHSVLYLVLCFITASCLWIMLEMEFLALALIVIYVGAVMVLFLFVVMMLDVDLEALRKGFWKNLPLALILGIVILVEMVLVLIKKPVVILTNNSDINNNISNANQLGMALYRDYSYPVELASLILLLGLVVAVALTLRKTARNVKYQNIPNQLRADAKKRVKLLDIETGGIFKNDNLSQEGVKND